MSEKKSNLGAADHSWPKSSYTTSQVQQNFMDSDAQIISSASVLGNNKTQATKNLNMMSNDSGRSSNKIWIEKSFERTTNEV